MQLLAPGVQLTTNLLLTEELPVPPGATYRVWFALNVQLGKILAVKIFADGRIETLDEQPTVIKPTPNPAPAGPVTAPPPPRQDVSRPVPEPARSKPVATIKPVVGQQRKAKKSGLMKPENLLLVASLVGAVMLLFLFRKPLVNTGRSVLNVVLQRTPPDSSNNVPSQPDQRITSITADSTPVVAVNLVAKTANPARASAPALSARQAARLLNSLSHVPIDKHPAIFIDAQRALTTLRREPGNQAYIDSLYSVYTDRGAQSIILHQQNGDPMSKRYAIYWYRTASALRPDPVLQDRIRRLLDEKPAVKKTLRRAPAKRSPKPRPSLFMLDPEVKH